jgi:hypothetical protein
MPNEPSDLDPQKLWQRQPTEYDPMTLAEIHGKARAFRVKIRRRNALEYFGCVLVIAGFVPALLHRDGWMMQVGAGLIMAATVLVAWQLHRRASTGPAVESGDTLVASYRQELVRQRDALRSVAVWYLAPFAPGMTLLLLGRWFQFHATRRPVTLDHLIIALCGLVAALVFLVVWLLNQRGADRLQRRIEEL